MKRNKNPEKECETYTDSIYISARTMNEAALFASEHLGEGIYNISHFNEKTELCYSLINVGEEYDKKD